MKKTIPEQLDAARNGAEFGAVLGSLFAALEQAGPIRFDDDIPVWDNTTTTGEHQ